MLYTSEENYKKALKLLKENPMICKCGETMQPQTQSFGGSQPKWMFLRVVCKCGNFLKSDIRTMPNKYNLSQGYHRFKRKSDY